MLSVTNAAQKLTTHVPAGNVDSVGLCHLLFEISIAPDKSGNNAIVVPSSGHLSLELSEVVSIQRGSVYCRTSFPKSTYPVVIDSAVKIVKKSLTALSPDELIQQVHDKLMAGGHMVDISMVAACLRADGRFSSDFGRRDLNFHLVQILRQIGHPAHFTDITAKMNGSGWRHNPTSEKSVGTRLAGERDLFVYVGIGTYGLAEWGSEDKRVFERSKKGHIRDIIKEFLTERDEPADTSEIIAFVLSRKRCQEFSVLQRLSNDDMFHAFGRGRYGLKKWMA